MELNQNPKVQKIINWRESLALLPDSHFFEIVRMYLGEVKTPFNKQKLIEDLGAFIRKPGTRKTIVSLLSETDLQLICAVKFIPNATEEKLASFFGNQFKFSELYNRLLNLEERLIIYRHKDKISGKMIVSLNPHLEDDFAPFAKKSVLLKAPETERTNFDSPSSLSPELVASFVAFIEKNPELCKSDGTFKKRTETEIAALFPGKTEMLFYLTKAFVNLSLLREISGGYEIDRNRFLGFARLDSRLQYAYLAVSAHGRFSRLELVRQARLLIDTAYSVPKSGFSRSVLLRLAYLISEDQNDASGISSPLGQASRFSQILNRAKNQGQNPERSDSALKSGNDDLSSVLDRLVDVAEMFGILSIKGIDTAGEKIFACGPVLENLRDDDYFSEDSDVPKVLSVDAGFNVTLMPGLSLAQLLPLMDFMELVQFDTAAVFEITRKSAMHGFDFGLTSQKIVSLLEKYSPYEIPQNLKVSLEDWSNSYSSAAIFKGYVLQVSEKNAAVTEKNPAVAPFISAKLAPGIYLLSVESDEEAAALVQKSGLDFIGKIKTAEKNVQSISFPEFPVHKNSSFEESDYQDDYGGRGGGNEISGKSENYAQTENFPANEEERKKHFYEMRSALEKMQSETPMSAEQKEGLLQRIEHKIILTPGQLRPASVKFERIEAGGMDYSGKLHIIEGSISNNSMVEMHFDSGIIVGIPVSVTKTENDANVLLEVMPEHSRKILSVAKAKFVKRVRGSVLEKQ